MTSPSSQVLVAVQNGTALVKVRGRATFVCSADFRSFVYQLRERGCQRYILDLTDCVIMDSTFLGMLAGFGMRVQQDAHAQGSVRLLNPNPRVTDLLENLGVTHLFEVDCDAAPIDLHEAEARELVPSAAHDELSRTSLDAHETLMALNPANIPKFKDVARFLKDDLNKTDGER